MNQHALNEESALRELERAIGALPAPEAGPGFDGAGVVIPGGGDKYLAPAWVCASLLRRLGCALPIQLWHLGPREMPAAYRHLFAGLDVECVDAHALRPRHPARILNGWELKPYALLHSRFRHVVLLDADNVPLVDPATLLASAPYREHGAIFWPDYGQLPEEHAVWRLTGVPYRDEPELESGQLCIDKARRLRELALTMWMNEHSDFWYRYIYGDKETFHLAWRKLGTEYAMPRARPVSLGDLVLLQHDFDGRVIFQHRNEDKLRLDGQNARIFGFEREDECFALVDELRRRLGLRSPPREQSLAAARRAALDRVVDTDEPYPAERFAGRGIVICGGGLKYFPCAWVGIRRLRQLGCALPIELWHLGPAEMSAEMRALVEPFDVRCVDALEVRRDHPVAHLAGWELKPYALVHSRFEEVLLLDADNAPVRDPEFLFSEARYRDAGALFWPDRWRKPGDPHRQLKPSAWQVCGLYPVAGPEVESGQLLVDKRRAWHALGVTMHLNEHSEFYYRHFFGDKDTWRLAWLRCGLDFAMVPYALASTPGGEVFIQHGPDGHPLFQHRIVKWKLRGEDFQHPMVQGHAECRALLDELVAHWELPRRLDLRGVRARAVIERVGAARWFDYERVGHDRRRLELKPDRAIGQGAARHERVWDAEESAGGEVELILAGDEGATCRLRLDGDAWRGRWTGYERMPVVLRARPAEISLHAIARAGFYDYRRVGYDARMLELRPDGSIGQGAARHERAWRVDDGGAIVIEGEEGATCRLQPDGAGGFAGHWNRFERMPIVLTPAPAPAPAA